MIGLVVRPWQGKLIAMGRKKHKRRQGSKKGRAEALSAAKAPPQPARNTAQSSHGNYLRECYPGCHVLHDTTASSSDDSRPATGLAAAVPEDFDPDEYGLPGDITDSALANVVPDISIEPPESGPGGRLVTFINTSSKHRRAFYVTFHSPARCQLGDGADGVATLTEGTYRDADGHDCRATTLIVTLRPRRMVELCRVVRDQSREGGDSADGGDWLVLHSDISDLQVDAVCSLGTNCGHGTAVCPSAGGGTSGAAAGSGAGAGAGAGAGVDGGGGSGDAVGASEVPVFAFPLRQHPCAGNASAGTEVELHHGEFLCTQGCGGWLTHFYDATKFAIDLACDVGTPVVAVADGVIVDIKDGCRVSGIHSSNLFSWNSITMRVVRCEEGGDPDVGHGMLVEYVHVQAGSFVVKIGDAVSAGQLLCLSGDAGFCPMPHLHLQAHVSDAKDAPTVPFRLGTDGDDAKVPPYTPVAGSWYHSCTGPCDPPS